MPDKEGQITEQDRVVKVVRTLTFHADEDGELMNLVNQYSSYVKGILAKAAIRNLLLTILPTEISRLHKIQAEQIRQNSQDYTEQN